MKLYTLEEIKETFKAIDLEQAIGTFIKFADPIELPSDEELAILFHNKYEELAPKFGYETRKDTKTFNKETDNGKLMIAVCREILQILNQNKVETLEEWKSKFSHHCAIKPKTNT